MIVDAKHIIFKAKSETDILKKNVHISTSILLIGQFLRSNHLLPKMLFKLNLKKDYIILFIASNEWIYKKNYKQNIFEITIKNILVGSIVE